MKKAILFDMDGVLVDSEPVINAAAIAGLREYGVQAAPDDFLSFVGAGEDRYIGGVAEKYGLTYVSAMKDRVYQIYLELVDQQIRIFPGIPKLLEEAAAEGYRIALASSADRIKINANLKAAGIEPAFFQTIISGEDVVHKKPAPDIYQAAARALDVPPAACVVIEDAINGVQAARNAGMACIAVTGSFDRADLEKAGADRVVDETRNILGAIREL